MPSQSNRRAFLKFFPIAAAFSAAPVVATASVAAATECDPMRGTTSRRNVGLHASAPNAIPVETESASWEMVRITKAKEWNSVDSSYVSSHMERRQDGKYVLVFDREK